MTEMQEDGIYIREKEFVKAFMEYCMEVGLKKPKWNSDYFMSPFADKKITYQKRVKKKYPRNENGRKYTGSFIIGIDLVKIEGVKDLETKINFEAVWYFTQSRVDPNIIMNLKPAFLKKN